MKRLVTLAAGLVAGGALVSGPMLPADALWNLPPTAPLVDAGGAANGCVAHADDASVGPIIGSPRGLNLATSLSCPESADVHRLSRGIALYELMADGTLRVQIAPQNTSKANTSAPFTQSAPGAHSMPCTVAGVGGTHTWVFRSTWRTKHDKLDTNPFVAKVQSVATVTC